MFLSLFPLFLLLTAFGLLLRFFGSTLIVPCLFLCCFLLICSNAGIMVPDYIWRYSHTDARGTAFRPFSGNVSCRLSVSTALGLPVTCIIPSVFGFISKAYRSRGRALRTSALLLPFERCIGPARSGSCAPGLGVCLRSAFHCFTDRAAAPECIHCGVHAAGKRCSAADRSNAGTARRRAQDVGPARAAGNGRNASRACQKIVQHTSARSRNTDAQLLKICVNTLGDLTHGKNHK